MDGLEFDAIVRRLATGQSRRSVLRGFLGGVGLVAAKAGHTLAAPAPKVTICHWSEELGYYELISVSENAVPAHEAHQHGMDIINPDFLTMPMKPVATATSHVRAAASAVVGLFVCRRRLRRAGLRMRLIH